MTTSIQQLTHWIEKQSPPGPPPRQGLVWKPTTHRWIRPHDGAEFSHEGDSLDRVEEDKENIKGSLSSKLEGKNYPDVSPIISTLTEEEMDYFIDNAPENLHIMSYQFGLLVLGIFGRNDSIREKAVNKYESNFPNRFELGWAKGFLSKDADEIEKTIGDILARSSQGGLGTDLIQVAAKVEFGLDGALNLNTAGEVDSSQISEEVRSVFRGLYNKTQDFYSDKGLETIKLYRGLSRRSTGSNAVESWTKNRSVAKEFASGKAYGAKKTQPGEKSQVLTREFQVPNILFSFESNPSLLPLGSKEKEVVILNDMSQDSLLSMFVVATTDISNENKLELQAPPGPPPREGLRWKPTTHRWIRQKDLNVSIDFKETLELLEVTEEQISNSPLKFHLESVAGLLEMGEQIPRYWSHRPPGTIGPSKEGGIQAYKISGGGGEAEAISEKFKDGSNQKIIWLQAPVDPNDPYIIDASKLDLTSVGSEASGFQHAGNIPPEALVKNTSESSRRTTLEDLRSLLFTHPKSQMVLSTLAQQGKPYVVGGGVRDALLGIPSKDVDIEVHGIETDDLAEIVERDLGGKQDQVGKVYGVFKVGDFDIALPRTETKTGSKHTDFDVRPDPNLPLEHAARRRDFTINALMYDPVSDEILDFFGGQEDIKSKKIKHIDDETFIEDPLRVYRAAQFAARFGFSIDPSTQELARSMDLSDLPKERVFGEIQKMLLKSPKPSVGLQALDDMNVLDRYFPEITELKKADQRDDYHAEGDVFTHTSMALDSAAEVIKRFPEEKDKTIIMLATLCHDLGKPATTNKETGQAIGHEYAGVDVSRELLAKLTSDKDITNTVLSLVENHLKPGQFHRDNASDPAFRRLINKHGIKFLDLLSGVSEADTRGRLHKNADGTVSKPGSKEVDWFREKVKRVSEVTGTKEGKIAPLVSGNALKDLGFTQGRELGDVLRDIRTRQEEGTLATTEDALNYVRDVYKESLLDKELEKILNEVEEELENQAPPGPPPREGLKWKPQTRRWIRPKTDTAEAPVLKKPRSGSKVQRNVDFLKWNNEHFSDARRTPGSSASRRYVEVADWLGGKGGPWTPERIKMAKGDPASAGTVKSYVPGNFTIPILEALIGERYPDNDSVDIPKRHVRKIIDITLSTESKALENKVISSGGVSQTLAGRMTKPQARYQEGSIRSYMGSPVTGAKMELFDIKDRSTSAPLDFAETVVHEMAHGVYFDLPMWARVRIDHLYIRAVKENKGLPSQYSKEDAHEFFAECYTAYVTNTKAFRKRNPTMAGELDTIFNKAIRDRPEKWKDKAMANSPMGSDDRIGSAYGMTGEEYRLMKWSQENLPTEEEIAHPIEEEQLVEAMIQKTIVDEEPLVIEDPEGVIGFTEDLPNSDPIEMPSIPEESFGEEEVEIENQAPPGPPPRQGLVWKPQTHRWIRPEEFHQEVSPSHQLEEVQRAQIQSSLDNIQHEVRDKEYHIKKEMWDVAREFSLAFEGVEPGEGLFIASEDLKEKTTNALQTLLNRPETAVWTRVQESSLRKILGEGVFRTIHDTGKTGPGKPAAIGRSYSGESRLDMYLASRKYIEQENFGEDANPIYAYLSDHDEGKLRERQVIKSRTATSSPETHYEDPGVMYGNMRVKLKPHIRQKTTVTNGDSYDHPGDTYHQFMSDVDYRMNPRLFSHLAQTQTMPEEFDKGYKRGMESMFPRSPEQAEALKDGLESFVSRVENGDIKFKDLTYNYYEAQIHGGLSVDDIEEIVIDYKWNKSANQLDVDEEGNPNISKSVLKNLDDLGIPWRFGSRASAENLYKMVLAEEWTQ